MKKQFFILCIALLSFKTASSQTWIIDSIFHQTQYRYYGAYLPAAYKGASPWPVVLTLHGGGGDAITTVGFTQMNLVADTGNFIVVYPQGTQVGTNCCSWAAGVGSPADTSGIDDILFFNKLLDTLITQLNIDTNRIYSTGLSQGGFMSQRLACQLSNRIAAIAPLCSNLDSLQMVACSPTRPISILVINGTSDLLVPYNGATFTNNGWPLTYFPTDTLMNFWATKNGCQLASDSTQFPDVITTENSTITRFNYPNCSCSTNVTLYKVYGGGHTWPGVVSPFYELIAGETNEDIHASQHIWNFLKNHSLGCIPTVGIDNSIENLKRINIYPNPTDNSISVATQGNQQLEVRIYDVLGNLLLSRQMTQQVERIDLTFLSAGIYFLTYGQQTTKIIKK